MFCSNCGKEVPDGTRFCTSCGQSMPEPVEAPAERQPPEAPAAQQPAQPPPPVQEAVQPPPPPVQQAAPYPPIGQQPRKKSGKGRLALIIVVTVVVVLAVVVVAVIFGVSGNGSKPVTTNSFSSTSSDLRFEYPSLWTQVSKNDAIDILGTTSSFNWAEAFIMDDRIKPASVLILGSMKADVSDWPKYKESFLYGLKEGSDGALKNVDTKNTTIAGKPAFVGTSKNAKSTSGSDFRKYVRFAVIKGDAKVYLIVLYSGSNDSKTQSAWSKLTDSITLK
jgi:hypothetical protein